MCSFCSLQSNVPGTFSTRGIKSINKWSTSNRNCQGQLWLKSINCCSVYICTYPSQQIHKIDTKKYLHLPYQIWSTMCVVSNNLRHVILFTSIIFWNLFWSILSGVRMHNNKVQVISKIKIDYNRKASKLTIVSLLHWCY